MGLGEQIMKVVVKVRDVVALAKRFEVAPREAMAEVMEHVREAVQQTLEQVMETEIELFLGQPAEADNKRNGYRVRDFGLKGLGTVRLRVPRDRASRFESKVVPPRRRYEAAIEQDLALLHLAGLSRRMLAQLSEPVLGVRVSRQEVGEALHQLVPAAKAFLERPLGPRRFKYLYVDGTNFHIRRTTVDKEPTLVVVGVDETNHKSVLAMMAGDKDSRPAWEMVFAELKGRGLDSSAVQLGIMDGLPGLADAFCEAFPQARVARCWVHKARNVLPRVPRRYQGAFQVSWDAVQYAEDGTAARAAFAALKDRWTTSCREAVACLERDLEALLVHYEFPKAHWDALRTTNSIERVHKEFKRRTKSMDAIGAEGLKTILAFTALRLEFGWAMTPIDSGRLTQLPWHKDREARRLEMVTKGLLN